MIWTLFGSSIKNKLSNFLTACGGEGAAFAWAGSAGAGAPGFSEYFKGILQ